MKRSTALVLVTVWVAARLCDRRAAGAEVAYVTDDQRDVVSVLDIPTNTITDVIPVGPGIRPCRIGLSPDGRTVYVANPTPDTVSVIDLATLTTRSIYLRCPTDACGPTSVIVSRDGRFLYAVSEEYGSEDRAEVVITEIDARSQSVMRTFRVNADGVSSGTPGAITADGRLLYVRVVDSTGLSVRTPFALSVIDTATGSEVTRLTSPPFTSVVALPSGGALAAATPGGLAIIDAATQTIERMIPIAGDLGAIAVAPDGSTAYVLGDCMVVVVDLIAGVVRTTIPLDPSCSLWDLAVTPDGKLVLLANLAGPSIIEIDTTTNTVKKTLSLKQESGSLAVAPDSATLYVANGTPNVVFEAGFTDRGGALLRIDLHSDAVTSLFPPAGPSAVAATPGGDQLYVANSLSGEVVAINTRLKRAEARIPVASPSSIVIDPAGNRIFVGSSGSDVGSVTVINRLTASVANSVALDGPVTALAIAPDGSRLYAARWRVQTTPIAVIDAGTLTPIASIPADTSLTALRFAPDGRALYAAESHYAFNEVAGGLGLIDPVAETFQTVVETGGGVPGFAVSPDGQTIYAPTSFCCLDERPPQLSVIDTASQTLRATAPISRAGRIAITSGGEALYMTSGLYSGSRGQVTAIDTSTLAATATVTVGVSPSDIVIAPRPADLPCAGDCNDDGVVTIAELITLVNIALTGDASSCPAVSGWCAGPGNPITCMVAAVNSALAGCGG